MIQRICQACEHVFLAPAKPGTRKYCSPRCESSARRKRRLESAATVSDPHSILRRCSTCKVEKPLTNFYKHSQTWLGYGTECKSCNEIRKKADRRTPDGRFRYAKVIAKTRRICWALSMPDYLALVSLPCHYCGDTLPPIGVALDRKSNDKSIGYRLGNVVPCCLMCNRIKGDHLTYDEMMFLSPSLRTIQANRKAGA